MFGIKKMFKEDPEKAEKLADEIIRNTYRTLMTRGQKGCFVYCTDKELASYFKGRLNRIKEYTSNEIFQDDWKVAEEKERYQ